MLDGKEHFELLKILGRGGFATTYRARVVNEDMQEYLGAAEVALKVPHDSKAGIALNRELEINAALWQYLKHVKEVNLVRYLGNGVYQGQPVMAMELMDSSLRETLQKQRRLSVAEAVRIIREVLRGVQAAHERQVFHRDLKPENILISGNTAKVSDFGLSRMLAGSEEAHSAKGTLFYMSPEILMHDGASFTSDIWSLGVTLYEMVTGKLPFGSFKPLTPTGQSVHLICNSTQTPACEICSDVPRGISGIIDVALSKEPKDRFHTISEMMAALDKWERAGDVIRTGPGRALSIDHELIAIQDLMQVIGQSAAVETKLRSLVERFPREVRAHRALGEHYNQCRRLADAAAAFQRGLTLDSENVDLNWDLGLTLLNLKQTDDAAAAIRRALPKLDSKRQAMAKALLRGRGERP